LACRYWRASVWWLAAAMMEVTDSSGNVAVFADVPVTVSN
jgi:hypothetical protein